MKILAISGTRADWSLLRPVLEALRQRPQLEVRLAVTGQHLSAGSNSLSQIQSDGYEAPRRVEMGLTDDDSARAIGMAMGRGLSGMAECLDEERPDLLLVLGDRYEIMAAVSAALIARVPVAHIAGGDVTEGAFDDAIRHAITKLSALHFVTNEVARQRVLQLGEQPERVFVTGSPGIDTLLSVERLTREELLADLGLPAGQASLFLVTYHPETLAQDVDQQVLALLRALEQFPEASVIVTGSNADPAARRLDAAMQEWAAPRAHVAFASNLGARRYVSALALADVVIGNSSSGLYEAPTFGVFTVNIGERQAGRLRAPTVIDCKAEAQAITFAIRSALNRKRAAGGDNPYGDGKSAERIAGILAGIDDPQTLVRKSFQDLK